MTDGMDAATNNPEARVNRQTAAQFPACRQPRPAT